MIPKTSAAPDAIKATKRISACCAFGMAAITPAPTSGRNTTSESNHSSKVMRFPLSEYQREEEHQDGNTAEQNGRISLDIAGLDVTKEPAAVLSADPHGVDRSVDHLLVDVRVHLLRGCSRNCCRAVDRAVEDVLVQPIHRLRDLIADRPDDAVHVQVVQVVLVDKQRVEPTEALKWLCCRGRQVQAAAQV